MGSRDVIWAQSPAPSDAQGAILTLLNSSRISKRSEGVQWVLTLPVDQISPVVRSRLIEMVNTEEAEADSAARTGGERGEGRGEYQIALIEAGLRLNDPGTIPGMASLGVQVTRDAHRFLLRQGRAAIPFLMAAFSRSGGSREPALEALVAFLQDSTALNLEDRVAIRSALLRASAFELSLVASPEEFPELVGAFAWAADSARYEFERANATRDLARWRSAVQASRTPDLFERVLGLLAAACVPDRISDCARLVEQGTVLRPKLTAEDRSLATRGIDELLVALSANCRSGAVGSGGCQILPGTLRAVRGKLQ